MWPLSRRPFLPHPLAPKFDETDVRRVTVRDFAAVLLFDTAENKFEPDAETWCPDGFTAENNRTSAMKGLARLPGACTHSFRHWVSNTKRTTHRATRAPRNPPRMMYETITISVISINCCVRPFTTTTTRNSESRHSAGSLRSHNCPVRRRKCSIYLRRPVRTLR